MLLLVPDRPHTHTQTHTNTHKHTHTDTQSPHTARWTQQRYRRTSSVSDMLLTLGWPTLQHRRRNARLTNFYKFHHGSIAIDTKHRPVFQPTTRRTRRAHPLMYPVPSCRTDYRKFSFSPHTIRDWNDLSEAVASAPTVESFQSKLPKPPSSD